jgi:inositol 1,4,5-triphosphate receptor type 1/inositol 1,4,5-triphosphate receptor type 3
MFSKVALLLTFFLILLMNYFFTLYFYSNLYDKYDDGLKCESLIFCNLETFDKAFKNNGGIGGYFDNFYS